MVENFGSYYLEMKKREVVTAKKKLLEERQRQDKASGQVQRERLAQLLKVRSREAIERPNLVLSERSSNTRIKTAFLSLDGFPKKEGWGLHELT